MSIRHLGWVIAIALGLAGCGGGYVEVGDGYDADYVAAPVGIEAYPTYVYRGDTVYDVDGRFYARHRGRWVRYRHAPPELAHWHGEHERERGRAEHQRER